MSGLTKRIIVVAIAIPIFWMFAWYDAYAWLLFGLFAGLWILALWRPKQAKRIAFYWFKALFAFAILFIVGFAIGAGNPGPGLTFVFYGIAILIPLVALIKSVLLLRKPEELTPPKV